MSCVSSQGFRNDLSIPGGKIPWSSWYILQMRASLKWFSSLRAGVGPFRKVVFKSLSHHKVHVGSWHITERQIHCHSSPLEFRYWMYLYHFCSSWRAEGCLRAANQLQHNWGSVEPSGRLWQEWTNPWVPDLRATKKCRCFLAVHIFNMFGILKTVSYVLATLCGVN